MKIINISIVIVYTEFVRFVKKIYRLIFKNHEACKVNCIFQLSKLYRNIFINIIIFII